MFSSARCPRPVTRGALLGLVGLLLLTAAPARAQFPPDGLELGAGTSPLIVPDGLGGAIVAWLRPTPVDSMIYVQRVTAAGAPAPGWPADGLGVTSSANAPSFGNFALAPDRTGGAFVAWRHQHTGGVDILALRVGATGAIAPGWPVGGLTVCSSSADFLTDMVSDSTGGAIAVWQDLRGATIDLYAQRLTAGGAIAPSWPANGLALTLAAGNQLAGVAAPDNQGGAFVSWEDFRKDPQQRVAYADVFAQHVLGNAQIASGWPADGAPACQADSAQLDPRAAADGAGGVFVVWTDGRGTTSGLDAYEQHLGSNGAVYGTWPADGLALCSAPGPQYDVHVVADGTGGSIAAWYDGASGDPSAYAVLAKRLTAAGAAPPPWRIGCGMTVCDTVPEGVLADLIPDGKGGAILAWRDNDLLTPYAERITGVATRAPGWPPRGLAIGYFTGFPRLAPDGASGLFAVWEGYGLDSTRVFAQHVTGDGVLAPPVAVGEVPRLGLALGPPLPNPSRSGTAASLALAAPARVDARILDLGGRVVRVLAAGAELPAGATRLAWDGLDQAGSPAPSGVYFLCVESGRERAAVKVVRLR